MQTCEVLYCWLSAIVISAVVVGLGAVVIGIVGSVLGLLRSILSGIDTASAVHTRALAKS